MERWLSAPGKLFLSGEYAVLFGGTARIAAVGPRGHAYVRRRSDRQVHLVIEEGRLRGSTTPLGVRWETSPAAAFAFAAAAIDQAARAHGREALGFDLALSPTPRVGGHKLGMGGSARAAVLAAEAARFMLEDSTDPLKLALAAHAAQQKGAGSGGDVAAIYAGGLVRYRRYPVEPLVAASGAGAIAAALSVSPPVDLWRLGTPRLPLAYAFTGQSASTPALITQVDQTLDAAAREALVAQSDAMGEALEDALQAGDFEAARQATDGLEELLRSLGPLETEPMRQILGLAAANGSCGKLSGAGGGDGCVLISRDAQAQAACLAALESRGFFARAVSLEPGLKSEFVPQPLLREWVEA